MVQVQKWPFFQVLFSGNISQENIFYDILERKEAFLAYKNKKFKKLKNGDFSNFFFWSIQARKMCFTIFQSEKTPFQVIKARSSKSPKIDIFPKGLTHGFGPKMAIFPTFIFGQYRPENCLLRYSRAIRRLSRL